MGLDRTRTTLSVVDLYGIVHRQHQYLAVADRPFRTGTRRMEQALDRPFDKIVVDGDLELDFAEQVRLVLCPTVRFQLAPLTRKAHRIANTQTRNPNACERLLHRFELGGLDDGENEFHGGKEVVRELFFDSIASAKRRVINNSRRATPRRMSTQLKREDCKVAFLTAKDAKSAKEMLAKDIS